MQVHTVRCQKSAWPLFQEKAKVRLPLCATRLAEGCKFHSLRLGRSEQRYRFDKTCQSAFSRAASQAVTVGQPCVLWCHADDQEKEAESSACLDGWPLTLSWRRAGLVLFACQVTYYSLGGVCMTG